jgi:hypothetical protein
MKPQKAVQAAAFTSPYQLQKSFLVILSAVCITILSVLLLPIIIILILHLFPRPFLPPLFPSSTAYPTLCTEQANVAVPLEVFGSYLRQNTGYPE